MCKRVRIGEGGGGLKGEEWVVGRRASEHQRKKGTVPNARLFYFDRGRQTKQFGGDGEINRRAPRFEQEILNP